MVRREWFQLVGAVIASLVLGVTAHQLVWTVTPEAAAGPATEVLGAVLERGGGDPAAPGAEEWVRTAVRPVDVVACGGRRSASATLVGGSDGAARVVTNVHVVQGADSVQMDGAHSGAVVAGRWAGRDLAELDVDVDAAVGAGALPIGPDPQVGDRVAVAGYPEGEFELRTGTVRSVELRENEGVPSRALVIDVPARPGHSGGAVLDGDGRVVGIVAARDPRTGATVAHPASALGGDLVSLSRSC